MKEPIFTGTCTAIITPFQTNGNVDYDRFSQLIERQVQAGIDAICVCGTTGESATLSLEEHKEVVNFCIQKINGRCKVIAGTGSNDTSTALYLSQHAMEAGADALLLVAPYYNKTTQAGLVRHYTYVADRIHCPLLLYNVPSRTGVSFTAETYQILSEHPNINGIKEASGNFSLIANTLALCGNKLNLWSGNDDHIIPMMSLGAKGVISVASNLIPEIMVQMTHEYLNGNTEKAALLQIQYTRLIDALFVEVNPIPIKAALKAKNLDSGYLRLPLIEISLENQQLLLKEMKKADILL